MLVTNYYLGFFTGWFGSIIWCIGIIFWCKRKVIKLWFIGLFLSVLNSAIFTMKIVNFSQTPPHMDPRFDDFSNYSKAWADAVKSCTKYNFQTTHQYAMPVGMPALMVKAMITGSIIPTITDVAHQIIPKAMNNTGLCNDNDVWANVFWQHRINFKMFDCPDYHERFAKCITANNNEIFNVCKYLGP